MDVTFAKVSAFAEYVSLNCCNQNSILLDVLVVISMSGFGKFANLSVPRTSEMSSLVLCKL